MVLSRKKGYFLSQGKGSERNLGGRDKSWGGGDLFLDGLDFLKKKGGAKSSTKKQVVKGWIIGKIVMNSELQSTLNERQYICEHSFDYKQAKTSTYHKPFFL